MNKKQRIIILGLAIIAFCSLCTFGVAVVVLLRKDSPVVSTPPVAAITPTPTSEPVPTCTKPRFGWSLDPDDVDILLGESDTLRSPFQIVARFDCSNIPGSSPKDHVALRWYYNDEHLCTHTYISDDCDTSSLTTWSGLRGKYLVSLHKRAAQDLESGKYELVVSVDGREVTKGTVRVTQ